MNSTAFMGVIYFSLQILLSTNDAQNQTVHKITPYIALSSRSLLLSLSTSLYLNFSRFDILLFMVFFSHFFERKYQYCSFFCSCLHFPYRPKLAVSMCFFFIIYFTKITILFPNVCCIIYSINCSFELVKNLNHKS